MIELSSPIEHKDETFDTALDYLSSFGFSLGGNWDYEGGMFDRALDEAQKVWLRIPFTVKSGTLDGETESTDAVIEFNRPFMLKHLYNEGLDPAAGPKVVGALFDQFQEPVDKDAELENEWINKGRELLKRVEQEWPR